MRACDYSYLHQEKENILNTIADLDTSNDEHIQLLDRIFKLLNFPKVGNRIEAGFAVTMAEDYFTHQTKQEHIKAMLDIIGNLDVSCASMNSFLDRLEAGGVINIAELAKPINSLHAIFDNDPTALSAFTALKSYGVGKMQKGPGEFALALLSSSIKLAEGEGDLEVDGVGKVELKVAQEACGGRLGQVGPSRESQMHTLAQYAHHIPEIYNKVTTSKGGSIGLNPFVEMLNQALPVDSEDHIAIRVDMMTALLTPVFGTYAAGIVESFKQDDPKKIVEAYVINNFEWYKNNDDFDAFIILSLGRNKTAMGRTGQDIVDLYNAGHTTGFGISIIPTKAGLREYFTQISLSAKPL